MVRTHHQLLLRIETVLRDDSQSLGEVVVLSISLGDLLLHLLRLSLDRHPRGRLAGSGGGAKGAFTQKGLGDDLPLLAQSYREKKHAHAALYWL